MAARSGRRRRFAGRFLQPLLQPAGIDRPGVALQHPAPGIDQQGEGQGAGTVAGLLHQRRPLLLRQQQRIGDAGLMGEFAHPGGVVEGDADDLDALLAPRLVRPLQHRNFTAAGLAPGRPEIDHAQLAAPVVEAMRPLVEAGQRRFKKRCCRLGTPRRRQQQRAQAQQQAAAGKRWHTGLVRREAVEEAGAAAALQFFLAATAAGMGRVPRGVAAAGPVEVADLDRALFGAARVVLAGMVGGIGEGAAVRLRTGQDVVLVGRIAGALDGFLLLRNCRRPAQVVAEAGAVEGVAVQVGDILGDGGAAGVVPRPVADPVAGVDRRLAVGRRRAQIGAPDLLRRTGGLGQRGAVRIGAGQAAEVGALARTDAGHEETQRLRRGRRLLGESEAGGQQAAAHYERTLLHLDVFP